ncbi:MAG: nickel-dependent hydrogenase large subunit [Rhodoferax sp.]|nr:nickel-dependent hydrogenase large subunit [Rhodoferax sp.]MBP8182547.1 nickel-dependent hydrogenase large subunit [Rhodoferax sp.]
MSLAGQYQLHPGSSPSIVGSRPVMGGARLGRLLCGQQGDSVVHMLGSVLTLCAHAQRRTASMVLRAAEQQEPARVTPESTLSLQLETARDHLRSMALDWPQRQSRSLQPAQLKWLSGCPFPLATPPRALTPDEVAAQQQQLQAWLESEILCIPPNLLAQWLVRYRDETAFAGWCKDNPDLATPLHCLTQWHACATALQPGTRTLDVLDANPDQQAANLRTIATALAATPDFAQRPQWQGACAETGVWSRLRQRQAASGIPSAWSRLQARWIELLELISASHEPGTALLSSGAMPLGDGQAIAWCEMARGLLLHWVQLDDQHRVQDYRVLAPTEWSFHPDGALARALTQLSPTDSDAAWCLASAYDPCVDCSVNIPEDRHA